MVIKPSDTECPCTKMKPIDHRGNAAKGRSSRNETLDFGVSSSTIIALKTLAEHIATRLGGRAFSVVFEDDLERCWPSKRLKGAEREKEIRSFAESQGWTAVILTADSGNRVIFRQLEPRARDDGSSAVPR